MTDKHVREATSLYEKFSGEKARQVQRVKLPHHGVLILIGECEKIAYNTVRDGRVERYIHTFRARSRPILASSHDGTQLYLLDGAYRFTDRGITDR